MRYVTIHVIVLGSDSIFPTPVSCEHAEMTSITIIRDSVSILLFVHNRLPVTTSFRWVWRWVSPRPGVALVVFVRWYEQDFFFLKPRDSIICTSTGKGRRHSAFSIPCRIGHSLFRDREIHKLNGTPTELIASLKVLEQKRYAWRGRCVIDGANDNEDDDDEDDDHDGDDDENNEYDYSVVVVFVFSACKSLPNTPRGQ